MAAINIIIDTTTRAAHPSQWVLLLLLMVVVMLLVFSGAVDVLSGSSVVFGGVLALSHRISLLTSSKESKTSTFSKKKLAAWIVILFWSLIVLHKTTPWLIEQFDVVQELLIFEKIDSWNIATLPPWTWHKFSASSLDPSALALKYNVFPICMSQLSPVK